MKQKFYLFIIAVCAMTFVPSKAQAQWRLGINGGATWNHYSIDKQYQNDYRYPSQWGGTAGMYTQYNFFDWFGLRAGAYFAQRNYKHTRVQYAQMLNMRYENNYLLFPVTANFSFGAVSDRDGKAQSGSVRGFVNIGVYGGAWLNTRRVGIDGNYVGMADAYKIDEQMAWNPKKDERGDFGFTGGLGVEYRFHAHWAAQIEATCYYSVISATKQYMEHVKDYRYHTTIGLQAGIAYVF